MNRILDEFNEEPGSSEESFADLLKFMTSPNDLEALTGLRGIVGESLKIKALLLLDDSKKIDIEHMAHGKDDLHERITEVRLEANAVIAIVMDQRTFRFQSGKSID